MRTLLAGIILTLLGLSAPARAAAQAPRNVILIVSDDHRYDFMSFMEQAPDFLETPGLDRMAADGLHVRNAFVTTSLCSPSRASILTGQYAHRHGVVDNTSAVPEGTRFFPQELQEAGWTTAMVGKWHMGEHTDEPRPGFDHWVSFRGQGVYVDPTLNVDGQRLQVEGYTTEILTDYAIEWLEEQRGRDRPFYLHLSHKATHAEFVPSPRDAGTYAGVEVPYPETMANTESNYRGKPGWVRAQRYSWHGVDYAYHGDLDFDEFYRRYAETLLGLDRSIDRLLDYLEASGLAENTLVIYMGDNGFVLGEHGLIDKRHAYEASIRIPMLAWAPGLIDAGSSTDAMVRNIDLAPTIAELADIEIPWTVDGRSVLPVLDGREVAGSGELLYEYYWEYAFPHTPTTFALRGDRFKYIFYHGVWDINELYDLETDPLEQHNLISVPAYRDTAAAMRGRLFDGLEATDGMRVPVRRGNWQAAERLRP
ncbi:MAG: sulfatase [Gemmatimonadota bacterium]